MASLTGTKVSDTYQQLLKLTSQGVGADASAKYIEDGLGTDTALSLSTTRVGIGTASPTDILEIDGTNPILKIGNRIRIKADESNNTAWYGIGSDLNTIKFSNADFSTAYMTIKAATGRVGIGTTSPDNNAHIYSTSSETGLLIQSNLGGTGSAVGGMVKLALGARNNSGSGQADTQSGDTLGQIMFEGQGTDYSYQGGNIKTIVTTGDGDDNRSNQETAMTFETIAVGSVSPAERMRIAGDGNVGIGTGATSPYSLSNYKFLSVSASTGGGLVCMDDGTVKGGVYNATNDMYYDTTTNHIFRTGASGALSGTERGRFDNEGNFGIGSSGSNLNARIVRGFSANKGLVIETAQPAISFVDTADTDKYLTQAYDNGNMYFYNSASGFIKFYTNGSDRLQIDENGFVIINQNDTGSAGSTNKQLSLGASSVTQFDRTDISSFTGMVISNSYSTGASQTGTATGIAFTHHQTSSGISYIASVAGSSTGDRSALHFGTRGSGGVKERFMLNDNGEVKIGHGGDGYLYHYQINSNAHQWLLYAYSDDSYRFNRNGSGSDEMRLESDGDLVILGNLTQGSDIRLKKNIKTIEGALSKVNQLRGVTYNWNKASGKDTEIKQLGMIADEVEKIIPELVKTDSVKGSFDKDGLDNIKSLKYGNVVALLVEAVKELSAKVESLEERLNDLEPEESEQEQSPTVKERVNSLEARVNDLENG